MNRFSESSPLRNHARLRGGLLPPLLFVPHAREADVGFLRPVGLRTTARHPRGACGTDVRSWWTRKRNAPRIWRSNASGYKRDPRPQRAGVSTVHNVSNARPVVGRSSRFAWGLWASASPRRYKTVPVKAHRPRPVNLRGPRPRWSHHDLDYPFQRRLWGAGRRSRSPHCRGHRHTCCGNRWRVVR